MKYTINMLSSAYKVKGQGVGSAYEEQVKLVKEELNEDYIVTENKLKTADITHYHTVDLKHRFLIPINRMKGANVGYVHFLPETIEESLKLPKICKEVFYKYMINFYDSMDKLVTVNPYFIERLADYGISKDKVTYIPNFVSEEQFYKLPAENKNNAKEKYGINKDNFVVLSVGQLQTRKGVLDFVEVAKKMPDITFVWAGGFSFGNISDGYKEIKKVVDNPPKNVKFLGIIEREKMNELYNMADVMFLASYNELFPMTILESMNTNVPVLLRDVPLYEDILFDFYLKGKTNSEFEEIILKLKEDKEFNKKAVEMSKKGHEFYSKENVSRLWDEFYKETLEVKRKSIFERGLIWAKKLII